MNSEITINDFSKHLFSDVNMVKFDWNIYKNYIIFKVLENGKINDWKLIKSIYGLDEIGKVSLLLEGLDIVTLTFLSVTFKNNIVDYKSYHPYLTSKGFRQKTPDYEFFKNF